MRIIPPLARRRAARRTRGSSSLLAGTLLVATALLPACASAQTAPADPRPIDARATRETRALFHGLRRIAGEHVLFGHQDDLAYGYHWRGEAGRSDVKEVAGAYPAVYGWDVGHLELGREMNLDSVRFDRMRAWIEEGYRRGGVVTVSWHPDNPVSGGNAWDTTRAVVHVLPGGSHHQKYVEWLDRLAAFFSSLRGPRGEPVPVVFRPYHEMSGSWFWWGGRNVTADEYRRLWRFTVEHMRDRRGVHNLLWAYSPNAMDDFAARYLEWYPGDSYVDVLGMDEYFWPPRPDSRDDPAARLTEHLRHVVTEADARGKVAALTETGFEAVPDSAWWTGTLLRAIHGDAAARRIAWVLVWRNAYRPGRTSDHFYAPYPGHASAPDFVRFTRDPLIRLEDDMPELYGRGRR